VGIGGNLYVGAGIQDTAIGNTTAASGAFTTLSASAGIWANSTTASTNTTTGALVLAGGLGLAGNIFQGGAYLDTSSSNYILASTPTTVDAFKAATDLEIGATTGTFTINNPTVVGTQTTQALYNTTATTLNFAGAATTLVAGATTGFQWIVNGTSISELDSQFFMPPKGTTAQRPGTPVAGYTRYNTSIGGLECHDGTSWQPQVFGTYFNEASSETDSSTTSTSWSQKVRLTTASLPVGKYRIGWSYNVRGASTSASPVCRVQIGDTDTIHNYLFEPKDASTNEEDAVGGFYYYTVASAGTTLNIDLDYSSEANGSSMTIRRARLEFWRVS
jgi:hypothetical protein